MIASETTLASALDLIESLRREDRPLPSSLAALYLGVMGGGMISAAGYVATYDDPAGRVVVGGVGEGPEVRFAPGEFVDAFGGEEWWPVLGEPEHFDVRDGVLPEAELERRAA